VVPVVVADNLQDLLMVVLAVPLTEMLVALRRQVLVDQEMVVATTAVMVLGILRMDLVVAVVLVVLVAMDPPLQAQQLLEVPEHPIVF